MEVSARERGEESEASEQVKRADECSERTSEASGLAKRASDQASTKRAIKRNEASLRAIARAQARTRKTSTRARGRISHSCAPISPPINVCVNLIHKRSPSPPPSTFAYVLAFTHASFAQRHCQEVGCDGKFKQRSHLTQHMKTYHP